MCVNFDGNAHQLKIEMDKSRVQKQLETSHVSIATVPMVFNATKMKNWSWQTTQKHLFENDALGKAFKVFWIEKFKCDQTHYISPSIEMSQFECLDYSIRHQYQGWTWLGEMFGAQG